MEAVPGVQEPPPILLILLTLACHFLAILIVIRAARGVTKLKLKVKAAEAQCEQLRAQLNAGLGFYKIGRDSQRDRADELAKQVAALSDELEDIQTERTSAQTVITELRLQIAELQEQLRQKQQELEGLAKDTQELLDGQDRQSQQLRGRVNSILGKRGAHGRNSQEQDRNGGGRGRSNGAGSSRGRGRGGGGSTGGRGTGGRAPRRPPAVMAWLIKRGKCASCFEAGHMRHQCTNPPAPEGALPEGYVEGA